MGPPILVMQRERRKVAKVVRIKVQGKVLTSGIHRVQERTATSTWHHGQVEIRGLFKLDQVNSANLLFEL